MDKLVNDDLANRLEKIMRMSCKKCAQEKLTKWIEDSGLDIVAIVFQDSGTENIKIDIIDVEMRKIGDLEWEDNSIYARTLAIENTYANKLELFKDFSAFIVDTIKQVELGTHQSFRSGKMIRTSYTYSVCLRSESTLKLLRCFEGFKDE